MIALRWLMREWRGGELGLLTLSLVIAVAIVSGISGFTERLNRGIVAESHRFLAADRVLSANKEYSFAWQQQAQQYGLNSARLTEFQSMVFVGDAMELVAVKAVTPGYPLKGALRISDEPYAEPYTTADIPAPGEVWLAPRLFALLGIEPGGSLSLGDQDFIARRALVEEPDGGSGFYGAGPRVLMNAGDIAAANVVQPGSLVRYRYLFSGEEGALDRMQTWLAPRIDDRAKWMTLDENQPTMSNTMQRAERFLLLAASFGVTLAGIAVALAARRYSERHFDTVAVMKALGADNAKVMRLYIGNLVLLTVVALLIGLLLGWALQSGLMFALRDLIGFDPPSPGWRPVVVGAVTGAVCLAAFALPPVMSLNGIPPLRVLRREVGETPAAGSSAVYGLIGIGLLMWWYAQSWVLALAVLAGMVMMMAVTSLLVSQLLRGGRRAGMQAGSARGLAFAALERRRHSNAFQVVSFGLAMMVMLSLLALRTSLLDEWQLQMPADTPNHFLMNVRESQIPEVEQFLAEHDTESAGFFPMVRARLTHIDGIAAADLPDVSQDERLLTREQNLSWAHDLPDDNEVIDGQWWQSGEVADGEMAQVSLEKDFAERLNLKVGSVMRFDVASLPLTAKVTSIRTLDWGSFRPNFFFLLQPGALAPFPKVFISSFYLPKEQKPALNDFVRRFRTVTLVEIDLMIAQAQTIIAQVSAAVELVLVLVVLCALLVTVANVRASLDTRLQENAILRTLGGSRQLITRSLLIEFALLGLLAGLLAAAGAELSVYVIQTEVLDLEPSFHFWLWPLGPLAGALIIAAAGYQACRVVVNSPPLAVLRGL